MTNGARRPAVVLAPGAQYLFWTTGVFYVYELAGDYDVVLLVSEDYRASREFTQLIAQFSSVRVCYVPFLRPVRRLHRFYATEVRRLFDETHPRFALSGDIWGMEMLYLFHFAEVQRLRGHPCDRIAINTSTWFRNFDKDLDIGHDQHAHYYVREYGMPRLLARWWVSILTHTFRILNVFLYPAFYAGTPLRPWTTLLPPVTSQRDSKGKFDCFLYYRAAEGDVMRPRFAPTCRFQQVVHPMPSHEDAARRLLHAGAEDGSVLILPSYVTVRLLQTDLGLTEEEAIDSLSSHWIAIIRHLSRRFPSVPLRWKNHPQTVRDPHWRAVIERVCPAVPSLQILDPAEKAERLIFEHRVVVGDISTVLLWAALLPSKTVISFDVFGKKYLEMAGREHIWYVDDVNALDRASSGSPEARDASRPDHQDVPTVRRFLAGMMTGADAARDPAPI